MSANYLIAQKFRVPTFSGYAKFNISILRINFSMTQTEGVNLTLPPHIFSVQVKSGACYITGKWERVQNKIKET